MKKKLLVFLTSTFLLALCLSFAACGNSYTVTFFTGEGSAVASQQVKEGETAVKPETDPVRENFVFAGWYKDEAITEPYSFETPVTQDVTVYARWSVERTVTFVAGNGEANKTATVFDGDGAEAPTPERDGYYFLGWFDAEEGGSAASLGSVTADVTVYAHWAKYYTVTYETGEGNALENGKFYEGQKLELPKAERQGYAFVCWCTDAGLQNVFSSETMPAQNITLYAEYQLAADADDTFRYIPVSNEAYAVAIKNTGAKGTLTVPAEHNGLPVVTIQREGFKNSSASKIVLPAGVTTIGDGAFANSALTEFELPETVLTVGSNILEGCESLAVLKLAYCGPDRDHATEGLRYLFGGNAPVSLREVALYYATEIPLGFMARTEFTGSLVEKVTIPFCGQYPDESGNLLFGWIFGADEYDFYGLLVPMSIKEVTVLGGTKVVRSSFASMHALEKVTLPDTLETIELYAFNQCTALKEIYLPEGLKTIGNDAFNRCDAWTPVLPSTVETLGRGSLPANASITSIALPRNLVSFAEPLFSQMVNLAELTIAQDAPNFTVGEDGALYSKDGTTLWLYPRAKDASGYTVPASVTKVEGYAFYYNSTLTAFDFTNITEVATEAFHSTGLTSVNLPVIEKIGSLAFIATQMRTLYIANSIRSIGQYAFQSNQQLTEITLEDGGDEMTFGYSNSLSSNDWITISVMSASIFAYNYALTSITFPSNWTTIPSSVVMGCSALKTVEIKGTLKFIGLTAFKGSGIEKIEIPMADDGAIRGSAFDCEFLKYVVFSNPTPPTVAGSNVFTTSTAIIVPEGAVEAYKTAEVWKEYFADNVSDVMEIGEFVINASGVLTAYNGDSAEVILPAEVKSIGASVFNGKSFITSVTLNDGLENIDKDAFKNCTGLTEITFPASLKTFYSMTNSPSNVQAFGGCTNLRKIVFLHETTIPAFGWYEFPSFPIVIVKPTAYDSLVNATAFRNYRIKKSLIFTDVNAVLWGTDAATSLDGTKLIKFLNTTATSYRIPDGVTEIGEYAFYGIATLTAIDLNRVVTIGDYAFSDSGLSGTLTVPSTVQVIGNSAFRNSKISSIVIQDAAVRIGDYAFENLPLTSLDLGKAVLSLGSRFLNSENSPYSTVIDTLIVPASVKGMGNEAFACVRIKHISFEFSVEYSKQRMEDTDDGGTPDDDGYVWDEWYLDYVDDIYDVDYPTEYNPLNW